MGARCSPLFPKIRNRVKANHIRPLKHVKQEDFGHFQEHERVGVIHIRLVIAERHIHPSRRAVRLAHGNQRMMRARAVDMRQRVAIKLRDLFFAIKSDKKVAIFGIIMHVAREPC